MCGGVARRARRLETASQPARKNPPMTTSRRNGNTTRNLSPLKASKRKKKIKSSLRIKTRRVKKKRKTRSRKKRNNKRILKNLVKRKKRRHPLLVRNYSR